MLLFLAVEASLNQIRVAPILRVTVYYQVFRSKWEFKVIYYNCHLCKLIICLIVNNLTLSGEPDKCEERFSITVKCHLASTCCNFSSSFGDMIPVSLVWIFGSIGRYLAIMRRHCKVLSVLLSWTLDLKVSSLFHFLLLLPSCRQSWVGCFLFRSTLRFGVEIANRLRQQTDRKMFSSLGNWKCFVLIFFPLSLKSKQFQCIITPF